jgi:hypothetical protein
LIALTIYYDKNQRYQRLELEEALEKFSGLDSGDVRTEIVDRQDIEDEDKVVDEIRMIKPQWRGAVVASGGSALPISGSKKLNLQNTPVIVVRDEREPVYVFPCKIGERYYSIEDGIEFLRQNLPNIAKLEGEMEDTLLDLISVAPHRLEEGLALNTQELDTPMGKTDLVLRDSRGNTLVIEVEREASDSSVGQILRLSAGFEEHRMMQPNSIRSGIVCYRINDNVLAACGRAGIEVWKYDPRSREFKKLSR